jgi:hypothetical protein
MLGEQFWNGELVYSASIIVSAMGTQSEDEMLS